MKATINGKRYNSDKCEALAGYNHYSNGNYSGTSRLLLASDGTYLIHTDSNGQDCYLRDNLFEANCDNKTPQEFLANCDLGEGEEKRLVALGLITMVE
jgi:hypothetical protein